MDWTERIDEKVLISSTDQGMLKYLNPKLAEQYIAVALSVPTAPELIALTHLSVIGSLIGTTMDIEAKPGYITYPIIWGGAIVPSGGAKSPSAGAAHDALKYIQADISDEYQTALTAYELGGKKGTPPFLKLLNLGNGSIQGQLDQLMRGDGSGYRYQDEMSGFFAGFNQHTNGKGNEEEKYLELWNGSTFCEYNKSGNYLIPNPRLSLFGMSQPSVLLPIIAKATNCGKTGANGMFSRFLLIYPDMPRMRYESFDNYCKGAQITSDWNQMNKQLLRNLYSLDTPNHWSCDVQGDKFLFNTFNRHFAMAEKSSGLVQSFLAKNRAHISRLAGVLAATDWALEEDLHPWGMPNGPIYQTFSMDVLERAVGLYEYFVDQVQVIVDSMQGQSTSSGSTTSDDVDADPHGIVDKVLTKIQKYGPMTTDTFHQKLSGQQKKKITKDTINLLLSNCPDVEWIDGNWNLAS